MIDLDNIGWKNYDNILSPSRVPSVSEAAKARADLLEAHRVEQRTVRDDFVYAVNYARMQGASWKEIEKQAGMSRQQMHKLRRRHEH